MSTIRLKLTDGTIVDAVKDCECITHDGPHWLHMDELDKERNRRHLARTDFLGHMAFTNEEIARLNRKLWEMKARNVAEIIRPEPETEPTP